MSALSCPKSWMHSPQPGSGMWTCYIQPSQQVKKYEKLLVNFSWMPAALSKNLNFNELLQILQLITILTALIYPPDGNNIKLQATKWLVKYILFSVFDTWLLKVQVIILSLAQVEWTKTIHCALGPKRLCTSAVCPKRNPDWLSSGHVGSLNILVTVPQSLSLPGNVRNAMSVALCG